MIKYLLTELGWGGSIGRLVSSLTSGLIVQILLSYLNV